jgi:hypothetical protein
MTGAGGIWVAAGAVADVALGCPLIAFKMFWTSGLDGVELVWALLPDGMMASATSPKTQAARAAAAQRFLTDITPALSERPAPENPIGSGFYSAS